MYNHHHNSGHSHCDGSGRGNDHSHHHDSGYNNHHHHGDTGSGRAAGPQHRDNGGKRSIKIKTKDTPGSIHIERHIHDEAVVISGVLAVDYDTAEMSVLIAEELEEAARSITDCGGIVGHIKAAINTTSTSMISVTEEKAAVTEGKWKRTKITLAAIVFLIEPEEAEKAIKRALASIKSRTLAG